MKKFTLLIALLTIIFSACVKQKNCDGCITGKWIHLETPIYADESNEDLFISGSCKNVKIKAIFYPDYEPNTNPNLNPRNNPLSFTGNIPAQFKGNDTIRVCLTFEDTHGALLADGISTKKLICIEEIE